MVSSSVWYAPTSSERLMAIEKGRASEELDRLEMSLANMQSSAYDYINLNARAIQLDHRNAEEFAQLERFAGPQHHRLLQQCRQKAAMLEQQLHQTRAEQNERMRHMLHNQQREAQEHAMHAQATAQRMRMYQQHIRPVMPNPYMQAAFMPMPQQHPMPRPGMGQGRPQPFYSSNWQAFAPMQQRPPSYRDDYSDYSSDEDYY